MTKDVHRILDEKERSYLREIKRTLVATSTAAEGMGVRPSMYLSALVEWTATVAQAAEINKKDFHEAINTVWRDKEDT